MNLRISKVFGSRGGASEILTMISGQKCQFLAISEDWTNVYACCLFKIIINNECLVCIHSLDFALIIYVSKIIQIQFLQFWHGTGPILPFVVLALWLLCMYFSVSILHTEVKFGRLSYRTDEHVWFIFNAPYWQILFHA